MLKIPAVVVKMGRQAMERERFVGSTRTYSRTRLLLNLLTQRVSRVLLLFMLAFVMESSLVFWLERDEPDTRFTTVWDAIWFGVVTLSTVGYGDLFPVTAGGRVVTGAFILFTLMTIGFLLTSFSEAILEIKRMEELGLIGTRMTRHVVVCGFGPLARTAIEELLAGGQNVAVICERAEDFALAKQYSLRGDVFVTVGEPTQDILVNRLNIREASTAVVALSDDARNLIASLNIRAVNKNIRVIVVLHREELRETLVASGVTYVATPNEFGGRLVASAAFEPEVARLVEDLASGATGTCDVQQHPAGSMAGKSVAVVRELMDKDDGPLLLAVARKQGEHWEVIPHPDRQLVVGPHDQLVVLARRQNGRVPSPSEVALAVDG